MELCFCLLGDEVEVIPTHKASPNMLLQNPREQPAPLLCSFTPLPGGGGGGSGGGHGLMGADKVIALTA